MDTSPSIPRFDATRALLTELGYIVSFRENGWSECWLRRDGERWNGHGTTDEEALEHALAQMLPCRFGQQLLARRLAGEPRIAAPTSAKVEVITPAAVTGEAPAAEVLASATSAPPEPHEAPAAAIGEAAPESTQRRRVVEHAPAPRPAATVGDPPSAQSQLSAQRAKALDAIEALLAEIDHDMPRFARLAPDRQRLELLVWICRARTFQDALPGDRDVSLGVSRVARRLTDIAKVFWPGSVVALQLTTTPGETMDARGGSRLSTWADAEANARGRLAAERARGAAIGLDDDGWADGALLTPPSADPPALLQSTLAALDASVARLDDHERIPQAEAAVMLSAARALRWIRGAVTDHVAWGTALGRLRRLAPKLLDADARSVREALDPRFRPPVSWAKLVLDKGALAPSEEPPAPSVDTAELRAALPAAAQSPETLLAWLVTAFDALSTPELSALLAPHHAQIVAVGELAASHDDRRVRRRLRDLLARIADGPAEGPVSAPAAPPPEPPNGPDEEEPLPKAAIDTLLERVRLRTRGKRVLFVSNRLDPELEAKLTEMLEVEFTGCDGSPRRVQAQCTRIGKGSYDLVMSATGFQHHGVDGALARAAGAAKIPYVRVDRGRPLTCLRALARDFGLLGD